MGSDRAGRRFAASGAVRTAHRRLWLAVIADCFEHFVGGYDWWIHNELDPGKSVYLHPGREALESWERMRAYRVEARELFRKATDCSDEELFRKREYTFGDVPEQLSRGDILTNLLLHERGHHGDLNTMFRQLKVRSFFVDYRYFVSRPSDFIMDEDD